MGDIELQFDYSVWTPDTEVTLCSVPWDNSYRDVVSFDDEVNKRSYFNTLKMQGFALELKHVVYLKYGEPVRLAIPFSGCNYYNYIVVRNGRQPIPSHGGVNAPDTFYYFINDIRYLAPNCTELDIQLDVWMTYHDRVSYEMCYVERGHIGIANENSTLSSMQTYLLEPEGFEQGSNYVNRSLYFENFLKQAPWVVVMSSADLTENWGTVSSPNLKSSKGGVNDGLPNGCSCYALDAANFSDLMVLLGQSPWVSQCIQMITVVPRPLIDVDTDHPVKLDVVTAYPLQRDPQSFDGSTTYRVDNITNRFNIPTRYSGLLKFYTHPFCVIELTNYAGMSVSFGLNQVSGSRTELDIRVKNTCNPPFIRAYAYVSTLNGRSSEYELVEYQTLYDEVRYNDVLTGDDIAGAIVYENFPQCAITNNQYLSYLASTANTRNYQYQAADWSQQKALTAASMAYDQSSAAVQNTLNNTALSNNAAWSQTGISNERAMWNAAQNVVSGAAGAIGSAANRDAMGAISGAGSAIVSAIDANLNIGWNNASTGISTRLNSATAASNARLANYNRDTNYDYAQFAAKGDYQNTIAAIQAKVQDAALIPPTLSGTTGGDGFNIANGYYGFTLKFKTPPMHFIHQIGEFWLRYGYAINRFITPPQSLKVMTKFSYWKMQNVMIRAQIPEVHKNAIRGILESGVTIWNDPNDINAIDLADNEPLKGVSY